jgi:polar amino acid transport system substrate-binding protein
MFQHIDTNIRCPKVVDCRIGYLLQQELFLNNEFSWFEICIHTDYYEYIETIIQSIEKCFASTALLLHLEDLRIAVITTLSNKQQVVSQIERILNETSIEDHTNLVRTCNIGIAQYPVDGKTFKMLGLNASLALACAGQKGTGEWAFYSETMKTKSLDIHHADMADRFKKGLSDNEFYLEYQPQIDSKTGEIFGVEALIRWLPQGTKQTLSPLEFIPLAEETGMISLLGEWVLKTACLQNMKWQKEKKYVRVAVNVSAIQFLSEDFVTVVERVLRETNMNPRFLELEITESKLLEDLDRTNHILKQLRSKGITIALDDFGKEYSSLDYLRSLEIDKIKIDRLFIANITHNERDLNMVRSIVNMANNLDIDCLAEGVETCEQAALLERSGCDQMQGFLFFKPQTAFPEWHQIEQAEPIFN